MVAMCQRHLQCRRSAAGGSHAGHDLDRHASTLQGCYLLASPAKNHRVAAFQPHHMLARLRQLHQHAGDFFLRAGRLVATFANRDALRLAPRHVDHARRDQIIIKHNIS